MANSLNDLNETTDPLAAADFVHVAIPGNADPDKDMKMSGATLYNSMNGVLGLFGPPTAPTSWTATPAALTGFQVAVGTGSNAGNGTIPIPRDGVYRVTQSILFELSGNSTQVDMYVHDGAALVKTDLQIDYSNGDEGHLQGSTLITLSQGDILTMRMGSATTRTPTYLQASFEVQPVNFT